MFYFRNYSNVDMLYCFLLKIKAIFKGRAEREMTEEDLRRIQEISISAYSDKRLTIRNVGTVEELADFFFCRDKIQLIYKIWPDSYVLIGDHFNCMEIIDCAAKDGKCGEILSVFSFLREICRDKNIYAECREKTSYLFFEALEKRERFYFLYDEPFEKFGEIYHRIFGHYMER